MNTHTSAVQQYIQGVDFPCTRDELIEYAQNRGATSEVMSALQNLPEKEFANTSELMSHVSEGEGVISGSDESI